jgi:5-methylthioadenosine/S-adenosylhomocysteine deaminase
MRGFLILDSAGRREQVVIIRLTLNIYTCILSDSKATIAKIKMIGKHPMKSADHIIHAKWIVTCEPNNQTLENHALVLEKGLIKDILPSKQATETYHAADVQHYSSHALTPGLINGHTHIAMNLFRGLADDLALMDWLNNHIWPAERKWMSADLVRDGSLLAMAEMIRGGTTCFNDMYFYPDVTSEVVDAAGMRAFIGMTILEFPTGWATNAEEHFEKGLAFFQEYKNHARIKPTLAPSGIYAVSDQSLLRVKEIAETYDLKINMHIQESIDEVNESLQKTQQRPIKRLQQMGLISPRLIAIHMCNLNDEDLEIVQAGKPSVVHCPESNMKLSNAVCPVERLRQLNINVALGTDGAASNNDLDMISDMRTAALIAKSANQNATALPAQEALKLATINGAKALGIDAMTGSLKIGKAADFIAINLDEIETLPLYHPVSQIVYATSRNQVTDTWVAGKQLMKNRELLTLDEKEIKDKARYWAEKIKTM